MAVWDQKFDLESVKNEFNFNKNGVSEARNFNKQCSKEVVSLTTNLLIDIERLQSEL